VTSEWTWRAAGAEDEAKATRLTRIGEGSYRADARRVKKIRASIQCQCGVEKDEKAASRAGLERKADNPSARDGHAIEQV
jgi:hypothetical protein